MGKVVAGIAGLGDIIGGALIGDAAFGAADAGLAFGAADAADIAAAGIGVEGLSAAAIDPTLSASIAGSAEAGLDAASASFGTFSPELFAANSADVATGGFGVDLGVDTAASDLAAGGSGVLGDTTGIAGTFSDLGAPASGVLGTPDSSFFTGTGSDLFSGAGTGPGTGFGTGPSFGDPLAGGAQGGLQPSTFSGAAEQGTVDTGLPAQTGTDTLTSADRAISPSGPSVTSEGTSGGIVNAEPIQPTAVQTQPTTLENAFPGSTSPITGDTAAPGLGPATDIPAGSPAGFPSGQPGLLSPDLLTNPELQGGGTLFDPNAFGPAGEFNPAATNSQFFTGAAPGDVLSPTAFDPSVSAGGATSIGANSADLSGLVGGGTPADVAAPGVASPGATPAATPAGASPATSPAAATAAGGGVNPLTGLRTATAGLNAATAGIRLANALNQPSFPALMPQAFPGGPFAPDFLNRGGGFTGRGGIAGGLAANRLAAGLVSGQSPQQLSQEGIISPARASNLQQTYAGIARQYAQQLGVSPASLSAGVKQLIAARALADNGLGGR